MGSKEYDSKICENCVESLPQAERQQKRSLKIGTHHRHDVLVLSYRNF